MGFALFGSITLAHAADAVTSGPVVEARYRHERRRCRLRPQCQCGYAAPASRLSLGVRAGLAVVCRRRARRSPVWRELQQHGQWRTQYPVVPDPESDEINQAWVGYGNESFNATLGRQRVMLDNQRFFGNVGWRQNEQTFDALATSYAFGDGGPSVRYTYLDRALRVFGHENPNPLLREWSLDGHLLNISQALPLGALGVGPDTVRLDCRMGRPIRLCQQPTVTERAISFCGTERDAFWNHDQGWLGSPWRRRSLWLQHAVRDPARLQRLGRSFPVHASQRSR
ncbi:MAG: alginate export family protein [Xanthomonadales bacterium]|nr:alginate export family protein [Xanthomonadales bacterium]